MTHPNVAVTFVVDMVIEVISYKQTTSHFTNMASGSQRFHTSLDVV